MADKLKEQVGGIQNTVTNIGASIGTALRAALDNAWGARQDRHPIVDENVNVRIKGLRASLSLLAVVALIALFADRRRVIPRVRDSSRRPGIARCR